MGNCDSACSGDMCKFEEPHKKPHYFTDMQDPIRSDGSVIYKSLFCNCIREANWKKYWIMAILKVIHQKENLEPQAHTIYSIESLGFISELQHKIWRGLHKLSFEEVYDMWKKMTSECGIIHSGWNDEDCEFIKRMTSPTDKTTEVILTEIMSFNKQGMGFTYELLGFHHQDIDDILDWSRGSSADTRLWQGLDEIDGPAMSVGKQSSLYKSMSDLTSFS